ncbi:MAG: hypothetical protein WA964_15905 [Ilumatobacter sp.]|uniref:trypsin-like serine protease n=1 Tax=Ilumatobacter sp. TaxID=1967498 RepID=UPI003C76C2A5
MTKTPDNLEFVLESVTAGEDARNEPMILLEAEHRSWVCGDGIQGLGIGHKITDGVDSGELALRVYVEQKRADRAIDHPVPKRVEARDAATDAAMGGVPITTDVIEIGRLETELFTGSSNPLAAGVGVGNPLDDNVGTLGAIVRRRNDAALALLSNAHVLARDGLAEIGEAIVQPSTRDGGDSNTDRVARLARFQPFEFSETGFPNLVDAAIAELDGGRERTDRIRLLGHAPKGITKNVRRGMHVHKIGRTSDLTTAIIQDVHFRLQFKLRRTKRLRQRVGFRRQVMCSRFTAPGDSGSLVLSSSGRAVGLHFAGSMTASIFNRIDHVLDALDVDLVLEGDA